MLNSNEVFVVLTKLFCGDLFHLWPDSVYTKGKSLFPANFGHYLTQCTLVVSELVFFRVLFWSKLCRTFTAQIIGRRKNEFSVWDLGPEVWRVSVWPFRLPTHLRVSTVQAFLFFLCQISPDMTQAKKKQSSQPWVATEQQRQDSSASSLIGENWAYQVTRTKICAKDSSAERQSRIHGTRPEWLFITCLGEGMWQFLRWWSNMCQISEEITTSFIKSVYTD